MLYWAVQLGLQDVWPEVIGSAEKFAVAMRPFKIPSEILEAYRARLMPAGNTSWVQFVRAYPQSPQPFPVVVVQRVQQPATEIPLGMYGGRRDVDEDDPEAGEEEVDEMIVSEVVVVHTFAPHETLSAVVHQVIFYLLGQRIDWLHDQAGFTGLYFVEGGDIQAVENLVPEHLGQFVTVQRWQGQYVITTATRPIVAKPAAVYPVDVVVNAIPGGVEPL